MKVRLGFVSNSSSSSFVIASKKGELTKEKLIKAFGVDKKSLFYKTSVKMSECLFNYSEKQNEDSLAKDRGDYDFPEDIQKALSLGIVYTGSVCDEDGGVEELLCSLDLDYEDEEIYIHKEGGY